MALTRKQRRTNKIMTEVRKLDGCKQCGELRPELLTFHHITPQDKKSEVASMRSNATSKKLTRELEKCEVLCYACHTRLHDENPHLHKKPVKR